MHGVGMQQRRGGDVAEGDACGTEIFGADFQPGDEGMLEAKGLEPGGLIRLVGQDVLGGVAPRMLRGHDNV
jgi:hypothetical protein